MINKFEVARRAKEYGLQSATIEQARHRLTDMNKLIESLQEKCAFKKMPMPNLETIEQHPQKSEFYPNGRICYTTR